MSYGAGKFISIFYFDELLYHSCNISEKSCQSQLRKCRRKPTFCNKKCPGKAPGRLNRESALFREIPFCLNGMKPVFASPAPDLRPPSFAGSSGCPAWRETRSGRPENRQRRADGWAHRRRARWSCPGRRLRRP